MSADMYLVVSLLPFQSYLLCAAPCKRDMCGKCSLCVQDKAEAKLQMLEKKAQEQQKARLAADEEWRHQQRERELARLKVGFPPKHSMHVCQSEISLHDFCRPIPSHPVLSLCTVLDTGYTLQRGRC